MLIKDEHPAFLSSRPHRLAYASLASGRGVATATTAGRPCEAEASEAAAGQQAQKQLLEQHALCRPGGYGGAAAPDPIPNSAVKRSSADGTSSQDAGE